MGDPGFPSDPSLWRVLLVWLVPLAIAVAAVGVAVMARRSRQLDGPRRVLSVVAVVLFVVPAYLLFFPTQWHEADGAVFECPLSGAAGSVMPGDHDSERYRFWETCVAASRRHVAVSTGAYAIVAGVIGVTVLRAPRRDRAVSQPSSRSPTRT